MQLKFRFLVRGLAPGGRGKSVKRHYLKIRQGLRLTLYPRLHRAVTLPPKKYTDRETKYCRNLQYSQEHTLIKREWRIEAGTPKKIFLSVTQYRFLVPLQCGLSLGWGKSALHMRGRKNLVTIKCYLSWKSSPKLPEYCQIQCNSERSP